ncbi:MFS transporter [Candidatus Cardinium hertigii]|uniref:MFS transporter n=1 Tax=Candidatus Cardinium hertigii TaxID=247481 RepID=A0A3N2QBM5_9BACT|nr:MFS transporter [Candidatus Cardinium hertigii]ROT47039.1 MFS transporter [Candidatus Cardinium hertigii]
MKIKLNTKVIGTKVIGAFLGTIIEYYNYSLYTFSIGIIAAKFFPNTDHITSLMYVFAIYATAYATKPIGAIFFGRIGDVYGRKIVLTITIIGMAIPTVIIGLLPVYALIGSWSTAVLVLSRLMQGAFVGGGYDGAAIYVIEHLGDKYRSMASALARCTGALGLLLGISATSFFGSPIFPEWGWRIPFWISLPLALIVLCFRQQLAETPDFIKNKEKRLEIENFGTLLKNQWRMILMVVFLSGSFGATYQIAIIFMKQYLPIVMPQAAFLISTFSIWIIVCFTIAMPISGWLADRFSEIIVVRVGLFGTILTSAFFIMAVKNGMFHLVLVSCFMLACFVAPINALAHGIFVKYLPVHNRHRTISLGHAIGSMLMGGNANYVCLVGMKHFNFNLFPIVYLTLFAIIAYGVVQNFEKRL